MNDFSAKGGTRFWILLPVLLWLFLFWFDWSRKSVFGGSIDVFAVVVWAFAALKILINSPSESERQRRQSDALNHR